MLFLSVISVLLIFSIIIFSFWNVEFRTIFICVFMLVLVFGWGICGVVSIESCYITLEKVEIVKSKSFIAVNFNDGHIEKYEKMTDFNEINDSTFFYKIKSYNMYGGTISSNIYLYNNTKNSIIYNNINKKIKYNDLKQMIE